MAEELRKELRDEELANVAGGQDGEKKSGTAGYFVPPETTQCSTKNPSIPKSNLIIPDARIVTGMNNDINELRINS